MLNPNNWGNKIAGLCLMSLGAGTDPKFSPFGQNCIAAPGATDALPLYGNVFVTKAGVDAMTLATPTAGSIAAGGNDGQILVVKSTTANAHTITTATNKINGNKAVATFGGAVTDFIVLIAFNGVWHVIASSGITLS